MYLTELMITTARSKTRGRVPRISFRDSYGMPEAAYEALAERAIDLLAAAKPPPLYMQDGWLVRLERQHDGKTKSIRVTAVEIGKALLYLAEWWEEVGNGGQADPPMRMIEAMKRSPNLSKIPSHENYYSSENEKWRQFILLWANRFDDKRVRVKDLHPVAIDTGVVGPGHGEAVMLGRLLQMAKQYPCCGYRIDNPDLHYSSQVYHLRRVEKPVVCGSCGEVLSIRENGSTYCLNEDCDQSSPYRPRKDYEAE